MAKKTYMIGMRAKIIIRPIVYMEVIAENIEDALAQAKQELKVKGGTAWLKRHKDAYLDEFREIGEEQFAEQIEKAEVNAISAGRASQYHSDAECLLCQRVNLQGGGFSKRDLFEHQGSYEDFKQNTTRYFAQLAVDHHGSAVRDNSIEELVAIGQRLDREPEDETA